MYYESELQTIIITCPVTGGGVARTGTLGGVGD